MADNRIIFKIQVDNEGNIVKLKSLDKEFKDIDLSAKSAANSASRVTKELSKIGGGKIPKSIKLTRNEIKQLRLELDKSSGATGAATSSVLELGRVISDAPYGIRGMANNLTQLISQLAFATKASGGFIAALRGMWSAIMGPLGIVLALTAAISALDFFFGAQEKAEESSDDTTDSFERQRKELEKLTEGYEDYLKLKEKVFMTNVKDREMMKALVSETLDLTNSDERRETALKKLIKLYPKYFKGLDVNNIKGILDAEKETNKVLSNKIKLQEALNNVARITNEIQLLKLEGDKGDKIAFLEKIGRLREEQKEARELVGVYAALDLELKEQNDKADDKDRVSSLLGLDMIDPQKEAKKAQRQLNTVLEFISKDLFDNGIFEDFRKDPKLTLDLLPTPTEETKERLRATLSEYVDIYKEVLGGISSFLQGEADRQVTMEQNRTNAMNAELNNRLLNENLSKDERARIQNEIAQNDEQSRQRQNAIRKKAFNTQKAFNIAMATIETYSAATKALNDPTPMPTPLRWSLVGATIANGLLQVATIARQKFQPEAASTPIRTSGSGGAGGVGNRSFDFNLIGNNQNNQLADAIGSTFDKPVKAYVVSKDITNQQQLDANTKSAARFGD